MDLSQEETMKEIKKSKMPYYKEVDGFLIPGLMTVESYKSALAYKPRPDDVFIATFPKCGTTWMQNILACIFREGKLFDSLLEFMMSTPYIELMGADVVEKMKRPGSIKTHLPYDKAPVSPEAKYIYVARNPKDCVVSFYYHTKNFLGYGFEGDFNDYFEIFINGKNDYGDYFDHLLSWYEHRNDPNVLFLTYEQLKKDTRTYVLKIAEFLGPKYKEILEKDESVLKNVIQHSSFDFMKNFMKEQMIQMTSMPKEEFLNHPELPPHLKAMFSMMSLTPDPENFNFVRKGIVGDWRNHLSPEQNARLEKKFRERTAGTDIPDLWKDYM